MVKVPRKLPLALINRGLQSCMLKSFLCKSKSERKSLKKVKRKVRIKGKVKVKSAEEAATGAN